MVNVLVFLQILSKNFKPQVARQHSSTIVFMGPIVSQQYWWRGLRATVGRFLCTWPDPSVGAKANNCLSAHKETWALSVAFPNILTVLNNCYLSAAIGRKQLLTAMALCPAARSHLENHQHVKPVTTISVSKHTWVSDAFLCTNGKGAKIGVAEANILSAFLWRLPTRDL